MEKIVLAYSGGLDTSVAVKWLQEKMGYEVVTLTVNLGTDEDLEAIADKALQIGASKAVVIDAREVFVGHFVWPALKAGAMYEGQYPLATALARPLIARLLVDVALEEGATAVAHGCTGKGNDQVRFDVAVAALAPQLKVVAPMRKGMGMTREEEMEYARQKGIPVPTTPKSPYSTDENLWGRSIECGVLEEPWAEPPAEVYAWTVDPSQAPAEATYLEIGFEAGVPVKINGQSKSGVELIGELNRLGGSSGVGRIDMVENRLIGLKSREIYEAPAAVILHTAHRALEDLTLSKEAARFKAKAALVYADLIYNGLWFSTFHQDLAAYVASTQRYVSGEVRLKLRQGSVWVVGRRSPFSLYNLALATYDKEDAFDHQAAVGFIKIWGLPMRTQAESQLAKMGPGEAWPKVTKKVKTK